MFYPYPDPDVPHYCKDGGLLPDDMLDLCPANHRTSILNHDTLTPEDIEEFYERFTRVREQNTLTDMASYLTKEAEASVTQ